MPSPLAMSVAELLELVEAAAASGDRRAGLLIDFLIEEEQRTGELSVISRLAAKPHIPGLPLGAHDEGDQHD